VSPEGILSNVDQMIKSAPWLAPLAVFLGGALTAANPCVLAMIPLVIGFVGGNESTNSVRRSFAFSLLFVLGLSVTFTILGMISALLGRLFGDVGGFWKWIAVAVCVVMGAHLLGILPMPNIGGRMRPVRRGFLGAFLLGMLFGIVSTPCAMPILVVVMTYVAAKGSSVPYGAFLLLMYALGHSVLVLVAGTSMGAAKAILEKKGLQRGLLIARRAAGVLIIAAGAYLVWKG
jgi:cytochrome c-type biogenesis protein